MEKLSVLSLNCHGYNIGIESYLDRFRNYDIILLQETWLSDCNAAKLNYFSDSFAVYHSSAMEDKIKSDVLSGRPFGGTAVLIRKELSAYCYRVITDNPRVTCVCIKRRGSPDLVICSVYMPWNDRTLKQAIDYEATVGCLQSIIDRHIGCVFLFGGDFNVPKHSINVCSKLVHHLIQSNNLCWLNLSNTNFIDYTYHSDLNGHFSLLDHFLISTTLVDTSECVSILDDHDNPSDHFAIVCEISASGLATDEHCVESKRGKLQWDKGDTTLYSNVVSQYLSHICLPVDAFLCRGHCTGTLSHTHQDMLERYYQELIHCMNEAAGYCIPVYKPGIHKHWWTPELDELKQQCIQATDIWKQLGRPRSGDVNTNRVRCKLRYKNAIKEAASMADGTFNDKLFDHLCKKDNIGFWKAWRKRFCMQNLKPTNVLNGESGDDNVRTEFTNYYKSVCQPNTQHADEYYKTETLNLLRQNPVELAPQLVDLQTMQNCVNNLKNNKAAGHDGICSEHFKYAGLDLLVHMCLLFNTMLCHSFVPSDFCYGMIVPLLKDKHGDASKIDMYRGITLSCSASKLFESVLLALFGDSLNSDDLQFGFKKNNSCCHALFVFNESVRYFMRHGSRVHCASLDASKAFDKVLHFGLFYKMLSKGISSVLIKVLMYWYSRLHCAVLWKSVLGKSFWIQCGVRQGGVLSPYLFALYIDDVIKALRNSGYGIFVGNIFAGCILYADDIILLSCSFCGLQKMVNICAAYGVRWDIQFNSSKSQCISFGGFESSTFTVTLHDKPIQWVHKLKYLGCFFNYSCCVDLSNSVQKFYGNFNNILSVLGHKRNEIAAVHLVKSYCIPSLLYGCEIWSLNSCDYHKMNVIWNNAFRRIFQCCWRESVSCLLYYCKVLPMSYIIDQRKLLFIKKIRTCDNSVIRSFSAICTHEYGKILSKYSIRNLCSGVAELKRSLWRHFVDTAIFS